jgi:hypothetical protein
MAGGLVAGNLLENAVLHTFRPEDLGRARGWTPGEIRVTPRGCAHRAGAASPPRCHRRGRRS